MPHSPILRPILRILPTTKKRKAGLDERDVETPELHGVTIVIAPAHEAMSDEEAGDTALEQAEEAEGQGGPDNRQERRYLMWESC